MAGPLPAWRSALAWLALVPLLWVLLPPTALSLRKAASLAYCSGVLWYLGTCYWVYATMHVYGGLSAPMSLLAMLLMCFYLASYHALFGFLLACANGRGRAVALVSTPFVWVFVELLRARVTSFPWNLLGYAQVDNSLLTRLAPYTGTYGLSFVLVAVNAAVAGVLILPRQRRPAAIGLAAAVVAAALQNFGLSTHPEAHTGTQKAVLLQPNLDVGSGEALNAGTLAASSSLLTLQASAISQDRTQVALWPESPSPFQTDRTEFTNAARKLAKGLQAPVIAGAVGIDPDPSLGRGYRVYNSAVLFTASTGVTARYDKIHLVPFGEFVPYASLFRFASGLTQAVGLFDRGALRLPLVADGHRFGVFLCYESIFGDEVRRFVNTGADVLVNLSDDGWYGDSSAPFQHINMARMRAIENRRWLLRDTNNGITAAIDPNGTVVETMPRHRRGAVAVHFDYLTEKTFYTRHGDAFAYGCSAIALFAVALGLLPYRRNAVN